MSDLIILTDSSADLGEDMARELDVRVIPLGFVLDEHTYRDYPDSREMDPPVSYTHLTLPTTTWV